MRSNVIALVFIVVCAGCGGSGTTPNDNVVAANLSLPTAFAFAADGRVFVVEQGGTLKMRSAAGMTTILQLSVASDFERGLLGIALDPEFASNGFLYLYYTASVGSMNPPASPTNRVSRFTFASGSVNPASELILLDGIASTTGNHNAGCVRFGPDGKLYVSTGDGGVASNSQSLMNLNGKILRINRDGSVPPDNPFAQQLSARPEIYCLGLRNPFRFHFRPSTGALYIGDVGQTTWEEVNVGIAGGNYGWPNVEGTGGAPTYVDPIYAYPRAGGASITGGAFFGPAYPAAYRDNYLFADWVRDTATRITIDPGNTVTSVTPFGPAEGLAELPEKIVDIGPGPDGRLYFLSLTRGDLRRVVFP